MNISIFITLLLILLTLFTIVGKLSEIEKIVVVLASVVLEPDFEEFLGDSACDFEEKK